MSKVQRSRGWMVTINNPTEEDKDQFNSCGAQYVVYGEEVGEEGTPHLQGYVYYKSARTLSSVKKKFPRANLQVRRGTHDQAVDYCKKDEKFVEFGEPPQQNGGSKMADRAVNNVRLRDASLMELVESGEISIHTVPVLKKARTILLQEGEAIATDGCRGLWLYGPPSTGKTHYVMTTYDDVYMKAQNKWWDGYRGEEVVLLDDFDCKMLGHYMKRWLDKYRVYGEIKGGTIALQHTKFIVTSNYTPEEIWSEDLKIAEAVRSRCIFKHFMVKHKRINNNE